MSDFRLLAVITEVKMSDHELLRTYARDQADKAFATLVERYVNLVYSAARRQVRSPHLAEEVAQSVFIELARSAHRLADRELGRTAPTQPLAAWLYVVTRRTALNALRHESRRLARETTAAELAAMQTPSESWLKVEAALDEAMETLNDTERSAIVLRFFQNLSLREVGESLGVSEDTAQKRVSRAVDQLRTFFLRRGIAVTATGLATDLSAHALQIAPAGLGASIAAASIFPPIVASTATTLAMTTFYKAILGATLIAVIGGAVFEGNALRAQRAEFAATRQHTDILLTQERDIRQQRADALRRLADAQQRLAALPAAPSPADATMAAEMNAWLDRTARLKELRDHRPDLLVPELALLPDESWFQEARAIHLETEEQIRDTFAGLRNRAERAFNDELRLALAAYLDTHDGTLPDDPHELAPFFRPPVDPAVLDRYKMKAHGKVAGDRSGTVIEQHSPLDFSRDTVWDIGVNGGGSQSALTSYVRKAIQAFVQANNGAKPTLPEQLQPYLPAPVDPAKLQRYLPPRR